MSGTTFAHAVGGGALPAPPWLLSYISIFAVLLAVVALRSSWSVARLTRFAPDVDAATEGEPAPWTTVGRVVGVAVLAAVFVAAIVGPDENAANIAPVAVLVVWRVGLPILALLLGDVMGAINPFVGVVRVIERLRGAPEPTASAPPSWVPAVFLGSFSWFWLAYHVPGSPRALFVALAIYSAAAVAAGLRWGSAWLRTGEGYGALSAAVARLSPLGSRRRVEGVTALMVVWVGGTTFDGLTNTPFWADVVGTSTGWAATALNTVGLVWMIAVAGGVVLLAFRLTDRMGASPDDGADGRVLLATGLGIALVPLATGWFIAHDVTLLLSEGQNFVALVSDPLGKGWDLFGTINRTIDYGIFRARWIRWVQLAVLAVGHLGAVVIAHDVAIRLVGRRRGMAVTWAIAFIAATSVVAAVLLVLK